jgi:8-oxo-dGTP diphosphatase
MTLTASSKKSNGLPVTMTMEERESLSGDATIPHIHVACAIIEQDGLVLAAQRGATMNMPLQWEFPGGKIDPGESAEACLRRELEEELGIQVGVKQSLPLCTHRYPFLTVTLYPFVCAIDSGNITLTEHAAVVWTSPEKLYSLDWTEADVPVIATYLAQRCHGTR